MWSCMDEYLWVLITIRNELEGLVDRLYQDVKKEGKFKIRRHEFKEWFMKQDA